MERTDLFAPDHDFMHRHLGPSDADVREMLGVLGVESLDRLVAETVPETIRVTRSLEIGEPLDDYRALARLREIAKKNHVARSLIGMGYFGCRTPPVILRNVLENPGWYTQYTPYQAEISQGRLEALMNFQTMIADLTALPLANASLLDEGTACAEAMTMCARIANDDRRGFFVASDCHPQTIAVVKTRALPLGLGVRVGSLREIDAEIGELFGVLLSYPTTDGVVMDYAALIERLHAAGVVVVVATDLLALTLLRPPGEFGADIAVGSAQRFGIPLGGGGPHAAFFATKDVYRRHLPGRIIGLSKDATGKPAYRLALQTREQHIRRDKATSNICTAQVLLANMAAFYAMHHGADGLRRIASRVHALAETFRAGAQKLGFDVVSGVVFDTVRVRCDRERQARILAAASTRNINLRGFEGGDIGVAFDETCDPELVGTLFDVFAEGRPAPNVRELLAKTPHAFPSPLARTSAFLERDVFRNFQTEHEMLRYLHRLEAKDLALNTSMIPLGSCTMKLNAVAEMIPLGWSEFSDIHPFAPENQRRGYAELAALLEKWLAEITGLDAVSLQPNAGSQGEYAGLLAIRAYHRARGDAHRTLCLIPTSAHGTNPASAAMAGMKVVEVACDRKGNVDVADLEAKAAKAGNDLAALMITYPSTHGVFESSIRDVCGIVHRHGGQVYLDGANMNAQVGLCRPGDYGADVVHLNLHKTFAIPHGGGGPGVGPIAVRAHLREFLPATSLETKNPAVGFVSAAPYGSASILTISWMYIAMMGSRGLAEASRVAILNANYMAHRLREHFEVVYTGEHGRVAHEFIIDFRPFKKSAGVEVEDVAKRLMDYGFHAPTMSFPVPGTMMIEPTESESRAEVDRLCDALIAIRKEIAEIEAGELDRDDNPLKNAPHTMESVTSDRWTHAYSRARAAFPAPWLREHKYWPTVARIDNAYGDRNLICTCPTVREVAG